MKFQHRSGIWLAMAMVVAVLAYTPSLTGPFIFDDQHNIEDNPHIKISRLSIDSLLGAALSSPIANRPVSNLSFALNYYFSGLNVVGFRVVNIIVHLVNGLLVYALFRATEKTPAFRQSASGPRATALMSAVIWLLHPLHTQSVAYIVQRMNGLCTLFYLASLLMYAHCRLRAGRGGNWVLAAGSIATGALALGSKEIAATLPFFIFFYEWYFFQRADGTWLKKRVPFLLGGLLFLALLSLLYFRSNPIAQIAQSYANPHAPYTLPQRLLTEMRVVVYYISLIFFPHPSRLNLDYDYDLSTSLISPWTTALSLTCILGLLFFAVHQRRRRPALSFAVLWYFGNLLIESSVVGLEIIFEHRTYLPSVFFIWALVLAADRAIRSKTILLTGLIAVAVVFAGWTRERNQVWSDAVTLWRDSVAKSPMKARPHNNLGVSLFLQGSLEAAVDHYRKAIELDPRYARAHYNLGIALGKKGDFDEALSHLKTAVELEPKNHHAHNNIGVALSLIGEDEEAIAHFKEAIRLKPDYAEAFNNLGISHRRRGEFDKAISSFQKAIELNPVSAEAHNNLGYAYSLQGEKEKARYHYRRALQIDPQYRTASNNLEEITAPGSAPSATVQ